MINRILLITFFLLTNVVFSQTVGYYQVITSVNYRGDNNHHCGYANADLEFTDGSNLRIIYFTFSENSPWATSTRNPKFLANKRINSIYFESSRRIRSSCSGHRPNTIGRYYSNSINFDCLDYNFSFINMNSLGNDDGGLWNSNGNIKVFPLLTIIQPFLSNTYYEIDGPNGLRIVSHAGFRPEEYRWEYNNPLRTVGGPDDWRDATIYNGQYAINFKLEDVQPGINKKEYYGKSLQVRLKGTCVGPASNTVIYDIIKTPPLLATETAVVTTTSCSYKNDGTATLTFLRDLESDEHFLFNLYTRPVNFDNAINAINPYYTKQDDKLIAKVFEGYSEPTVAKKIVLTDLAAGTYYFLYKTTFANPADPTNRFGSGFFPSQLNLPSSNPLFDHLANVYVPSIPDTRTIIFKIEKPTPLVYTARMAQPKCAGGSVEIVINTKGGRPPYYYCINCPNDVDRIQYTTDAGVPNPDHGLPNGDYIITIPGSITGSNISIKVTDSKNCVDPATIAPQ